MYGHNLNSKANKSKKSAIWNLKTDLTFRNLKMLSYWPSQANQREIKNKHSSLFFKLKVLKARRYRTRWKLILICLFGLRKDVKVCLLKSYNKQCLWMPPEYFRNKCQHYFNMRQKTSRKKWIMLQNVTEICNNTVVKTL